jgi:addiction module HigA family antidote
MAMADPSHPGEILKEDVLAPLGLSVTRAAEILGVTRSALSAVLNGRAALSAEMALRIEKAFGPRADHLLRVQLSHDLARVRRREAEITAGVRRYEPSVA